MHNVKEAPSANGPNFSSGEICEGSRSGWRSSQRRKTASGQPNSQPKIRPKNVKHLQANPRRITLFSNDGAAYFVYD